LATVAAAYPFIEVHIDTSALTPVAQRAPGVLAVVGKTPTGAAGGSVAVNSPTVVKDLDDAATFFARRNPDGSVASTPLFDSLAIALLQDPQATKLYGVKVAADDYAAALQSLEALDDVTLVTLANEVDVGAAGPPPTGLVALKQHCENMSAQGRKRIGVAMVNPTVAKSPTYAADVDAALAPIKSDSSRMVVVAARGATTDVATAAAATIAGYPPQVSTVLKPISGVSIPAAQAYTPAEITALSELQIDPIIKSSLIVGEQLRFAEGRAYTTNADLLYIDIVRVLDDIDFRLKAGLIGTVGDARITKAGLTHVAIRTDGILSPLVASAEIDAYDITIPVLGVLQRPESTWTPADTTLVTTARANRAVDMLVSVTYGPAVHRLIVTLAPTF
jgi:hypothetical protein